MVGIAPTQNAMSDLYIVHTKQHPQGHPGWC